MIILYSHQLLFAYSQTLQDYSVVVKNPPKDADNPDEWYEFFSKFGNVRLVTVLKENASLSDVLLMRLLESRKKLEVQQSKYLHVKHLSRNQTRRNSRILLLDAELEAMYKRQFDVIRVYVTFDLEDHQRVCLEEFEPPNIQLLCPQRGIAHKAIFREGVVLAVGESPEFDNIYWQNLEVDDMSRRLRWISTSLMTIALLVACYYLISWVHDDHLDQLPIVITIVDGALPYFFEFFTAYERAADEDYRQDSLLIKLFLGRLLITIIFPYIFTSWASILDTNSVTTFINTQLAACLISPLISVVDPYGVFKRYIMSPLLSETQIEMNEYWAGSEWSLAERYTNLAKVVFLALFYSLVTPLGLVIGAVAMLLVFTVDRYLLLRTWKPPKMLDATMALRVRHFFALAIAAHLYVSSRFVYSWPMDEVYVKSQADGNGYVRVNKFPPLNILEMEPQAWHSQGQAATIVAYKWVTVLVIGAAAYSVFGTFILAQLAEIFCNQQGESFGEVMGIQFITVPKIGCYCPVAERSGETFICADLSQVTAMEEFQPSVFAANNLADLVPPEIRAKVLSSVKWYSGFGKYKHADHLRKSFMELNIPPLSGAAPHSLLTNFALSNAGRVHPQATSSHNDEVVEDEESVLWSPNAPLHTFDSTLDMSLGIGTKVDVGAAVKDGEVQEQKKIGRRVKRNRSTSPAVTPTGKLAPIKLPKSQL
jgi:hypothetical protein